MGRRYVAKSGGSGTKETGLVASESEKIRYAGAERLVVPRIGL